MPRDDAHWNGCMNAFFICSDYHLSWATIYEPWLSYTLSSSSACRSAAGVDGTGAPHRTWPMVDTLWIKFLWNSILRFRVALKWHFPPPLAQLGWCSLWGPAVQLLNPHWSHDMLGLPQLRRAMLSSHPSSWLTDYLYSGSAVTDRQRVTGNWIRGWKLRLSGCLFWHRLRPPHLSALGIKIGRASWSDLVCLIEGSKLFSYITSTDIPAYSDTLGTWGNCHCKRGSL